MSDERSEFGPYRLGRVLATSSQGRTVESTRVDAAGSSARLVAHLCDAVSSGPDPSALVGLRHPAVNTLLDVVVARCGGREFRAFVWPYLPGDRLDASAASPEEALDVVVHLAEGLTAVHREGVPHGRVEAHNVRRDARGAWRLLDVGRPRRHASLDADLRAFGSLARALTARSDVPGLEIVLDRLERAERDPGYDAESMTLDLGAVRSAARGSGGGAVEVRSILRARAARRR